MKMRSIDTPYKGYNFRSRLEARWAIFFDGFNLPWTYEREWFRLSNGQAYLPDFCVKTPQGQDIWYEIKPLEITDNHKFRQFALDGYKEMKETQQTFRARLLSGDPVDVCSTHGNCPRCGFFLDPKTDFQIYRDEIDFASTYCEACDWETPGGSGNPKEKGVFGVTVEPYKGDLHFSRTDYEMLINITDYYARVARSYRFGGR